MWFMTDEPRNLAVICNVKCDDGTPLKHMGRHVHRRDVQAETVEMMPSSPR